MTVLLNIDWNYFNVTKFYTEWKTKGILNCKCLQWEMNQIYKNYVKEGFKKSVENSTLGWLGESGSGVGQNPQKKIAFNIHFRPF